MTNDETSGERAVFGATHHRLIRQHVARYTWASKYVNGKRILDIACGTGYGAEILAIGRPSTMIGGDVWIAPDNRFQRGGGVLVNCDAEHLPFESGSFDLVTSFETIEHVPNDKLMIAEIRRVLAADGSLLLSTPNRRVSSPHLESCFSGAPTNPFHLREYSQGELSDLLRPYFDRIETYGQNVFAVYDRTTMPIIRKMRSLFVRAQRDRVRKSGRFCNSTEILIAKCS